MEGASSEMVKVQLQTMGGRGLELMVESWRSIFDLKKQIARRWQVGVSHQRIIFGIDEPCDLESLSTVASRAIKDEGAPLAGVVILTKEALDVDFQKQVDILVEKLGAAESWVRGRAVIDLGNIVSVSEAELTYVCLAIQSLLRSSHCKRSCLEALVKVAHKGGSNVSAPVDVAAQCLHDKNELVRLSAVEAITKMAPRGDKATVDKMQRLLSKGQTHAKIGALLVLGEVAGKEHDGIFDLIGKYTEDKHDDVRMAASEALTSML